MSDPLLRSPSSPHPSEKHDHRSDPIYARFQIKLCAAIIVTVVVLTIVVLATHHYGSDDTPTPAPTPAFPLMMPGAYAASFYRMTVGSLESGNVTITASHWKTGDMRYGTVQDYTANVALRVLVNGAVGGSTVENAGIEAHAYCSVRNSTSRVPDSQLLNATYVTDSAMLGMADPVQCDQWRGWSPNADTGALEETLYWQRRDNGQPARLQRVADPVNGDYWIYQFATTAAPAAWYSPFVCPAGLPPVPPIPASTTALRNARRLLGL